MATKEQQEKIVKKATRSFSQGDSGFINTKNGLFTFYKGQCYRLSGKYAKDKKLIQKAERIAKRGVFPNDYPIIKCKVK